MSTVARTNPAGGRLHTATRSSARAFAVSLSRRLRRYALETSTYYREAESPGSRATVIDACVGARARRVSLVGTTGREDGYSMIDAPTGDKDVAPRLIQELAEKGVVTRTIMLEATPQFGCEQVVLALGGDA